MITAISANVTLIQQTLQLTDKGMSVQQRRLIETTAAEHNKYIIAYCSAQWQSFCLSIKQTMTGTDQEKDSILRRRLLKFFHNFSLEKNRYYVERREVTLDVSPPLQISNNSILLYGIDFLTEAKIQQYFYPYYVTVDFYDDSHCSVSFENEVVLANSLWQIMQTSAKNNEQAALKKMMENDHKKLEWTELTSYYELCFERVLWFRFLTNHDYIHKKNLGESVMHQTYAAAKHNFFSDIQKSLEKKDEKRRDTRDRQFSRSRDKGRERSRSPSRLNSGRNGKNKDKFNDEYGNTERCICRTISSKLKKLIEYMDRDCHREERSDTEIEEEHESKARNARRSKKNDSKAKSEVNEQKATPVKRLANYQSQPPSAILSTNLLPERGSRGFQQRFDQSEDVMIKSLVNELERYRFDEDGAKFEEHIKSLEKFMGQPYGVSAINMEEESYLQYIDEQ